MGIRTKDAAIKEHLSEAVDRYSEAQTVYTKTEFPEAWAAIQNSLGAVLQNQGTRTGGEAGTRLLAQAVAAYRATLEIRTREHLPEDWAQTHNNLAKAALLLEDWPTAAESYRNVLALYPDYNKAYQASTPFIMISCLPTNRPSRSRNNGWTGTQRMCPLRPILLRRT